MTTKKTLHKKTTELPRIPASSEFPQVRRLRRTRHARKAGLLRLPHLTQFLILLLALTLCFALAGCGEEEGDTGEPPAAETGQTGETNETGTVKEEKDPVVKAMDALLARLDEERACVYVYRDFGATENHFTQKAKMAGLDDTLVADMNENWQEDPYSGTSCIRCEQKTRHGDWGGWLFLNGYLPEGETVPRLNDGTTDGQGLDLSGAKELRFWAKGEDDGVKVEFFTAGFGYDGETGKKTAEYPDSAKQQSLGVVELGTEWKEYVIPLDGVDMSDITCGFGYVLSGQVSDSRENVFYLDEVWFTGDIAYAKEAPVLLRSYDTENPYIQNAAFSYDNALALMAFLSGERRKEAKAIADAFVYAVQNDRGGVAEDAAGSLQPLRVRNAYAAGDIRPFPGWGSGARLPGWYDQETGEWYEDRYQVGSNTGNTSYVALALLQYYTRYGGKEYLETARSLMDWVLVNCFDGGDGFNGGYDGWSEGANPVVYPFTYKSIEHNIDAYSAFSALYGLTGDPRYYDAARATERFIDSMYDRERGYFYTGTLDDGVTPNESVVVLDAQVWCAMALGSGFEQYGKSLDTVAAMRTEEGGYPFCMENANGGWWAEGTAYTALMYRLNGEQEKYEDAMQALTSIQLDSGLFPAATVDHLSTGMDLFDGSPWEYSTDPHIAPTAWYIMAANGFNPYEIGIIDAEQEE
ncbi:MAG: hypothetical protein IJH77_02200 [Mogibacterium sp.]|nr:hypothetical protein [Mogibacterium sp.]